MEASMPFYTKQSNFKLQFALKTTSKPGDYPLLLDQCSKLFPSEMTIANSDYSVVSCDIASQKIIGTF